ncbi:lytic transglycosylase domain-containing protein [Roseivivax sp. GX 12232]|uniref:lytic transglycosylase domain-containing protein n=1 Tax=Roseivivax sp. GX 12232 TaxID=2900547 RepID=UPI001E3B411D|nr:lytic transglycosylase domain-containing protein [Roseivivax sp. GX 12232]MCE0504417.1 lytic transglycosylase domain-containing protein [Roseivivax sp. GX 12232]
MPHITRSWLLAALLAAAPAGAETPGGDFSARFVKPPAPGSQKRVTVQIAPRANPAVYAAPEAKAPPEPGAAPGAEAASPRAPGPEARYGWFWDQVAPERAAAAGPGRLEPALAALKSGPGGAPVAAPRMQAVQDLAARYGRDLLLHSVDTQVSPALALAVMAVESGGRPEAVSRAGAQGLMQLMPETAASFGVSDAFDPAQNIRGGIAFLDRLMRAYGGDPVLVLAGYNAGETALAEAGGVPPFAETRDYVPKVLAAFEVARGLCKTPPMLLSDGCVFNVSP